MPWAGTGLPRQAHSHSRLVGQLTCQPSQRSPRSYEKELPARTRATCCAPWLSSVTRGSQIGFPSRVRSAPSNWRPSVRGTDRCRNGKHEVRIEIRTAVRCVSTILPVAGERNRSGWKGRLLNEEIDWLLERLRFYSAVHLFGSTAMCLRKRRGSLTRDRCCHSSDDAPPVSRATAPLTTAI